MKISVAAKPFFHGLVAAAILYGALIAYMASLNPDALRYMESQLASVTVPIEIIAPVEEEISIPVPVPSVAEVENVLPVADETPPVQQGLAPAPKEGLFERAASGMLPVRGENTTPFDYYRRPFTPSEKPVIALIFDDYGLSESASQKALDAFPETVSFLVSSYSAEPQKWSDLARAAGHETWMKVNFETRNYPVSDPGPQALLANASLQYNEDRLLWNLSRATGYAGIAGATDSVFESAASILQPLIKQVYRRGLAFMEINPGASPMIETLAVNAQAPYTQGDLVLNETESGLEQHIKALEETAKSRGYAVGIIRPYDASYAAISAWMKELDGRGFALAPVSAIAASQLFHEGGDEVEEVVTEPSPEPAAAH